MKAAVLHAPNDLRLEEIPDPTPGDGEVIVAPKACGICQTDQLAFTGGRLNWEPGSVMGHEFAGVITQVGSRVEGFDVGDEVVVSPVGTCGRCRHCQGGMQHYCDDGYVIGGDGQSRFYNGAFAELCKVPATSLFPKPETLSFEAAALTEPLAGSYKGMIAYSQMTVGEDVVILGVGSMGLLLTQVASAAGAGTLIGVDLVESRLAMARECGATHTINGATEDVKQRVHEILPQGPDLVFEAAGALEAAELTFDLCRRGTRINVFGVIVPGTVPVSPRDIHFTEIRMDASFSVTPTVMRKSITLQEKGLVDASKIITHRFPLEGIHDAVAAMDREDRVKVMVGG
jgi:L-iditol 2-dehydrogenase